MSSLSHSSLLSSPRAGHLPSLPVSNDEFSLPTANGNETVYSFNASLHGFLDRDARDDAGSLHSYSLPLVSHNGSLKTPTKAPSSLLQTTVSVQTAFLFTASHIQSLPHIPSNLPLSLSHSLHSSTLSFAPPFQHILTFP